MNRSIGAKILGCTMGASMVLGGIGAAMAQPALATGTTAGTGDEGAGNAGPQVWQREAVDYAKVANVQGNFSFTQDTLTPSDEVFNLFGTAATAICAKPGYAFDQVTREEYYLNVGGNVEQVYSIGLDEIERMEAQMQEMRCTCGMSANIAMASVTGVKVSDMLDMAGVAADANTITFKDKDGYGLPMPLSYVLEKDAMLVYQIGDKPLSDGERLQVWIPDTVAKYFTRAVVDIEVSTSAEVPEVQGPDADQRAKVGIVSPSDDEVQMSILNTVTNKFSVGDLIAFEGYADDCGTQVVAVEFSLDGGRTWTAYDTTSANTQDWVYWHFDYVPEAAGTYKLDVRAVTEDGTVSPLASSVVFEVDEASAALPDGE